MSIEVGDFVTCPYTTNVCIVLNIEKNGKAKIESIADKHTYGCSVKDLALIQEQDIDPEIGTKVIYKNELWIIFNKTRTNYKNGNWKVYDLKNVDTKELIFGIEREQFTIYNPIIKGEVYINPVITTGSFVYHKTKDNYGVVMQINDNILAIRDLVNEDIGFLYEEESDHLEIVREEDIKLKPGMKIIYEGKVGTYFNSGKVDNGETVHYITETGLSVGDTEYQIYNPYFYDYEEKDGVKVLKLRDFIDEPLKPFNEELYFMGVDPFQNEEPLGCSTSFPVEELRKKVEYKDFIKMAENDVEFDNKEGIEEDITYEQEVFEYKAGYFEEGDENNLLLKSLAKLQTYLDQLDPKANFSNEDFCKGISHTLLPNIAINFINKIIIRKYGQKVVLKLIFNGYSTQISFTISTREDSNGYVVKLLVFDNFKCKESFTGNLASAYKYFANLINSQDLNKSLFDKPENSIVEDIVKETIDNDFTSQGLKQSEGKLMVQELYWPFIEQMARVMTINKEKYPPKNYLKPMDKEELLSAAQRHQLSMWLGEEIDPTDGQPHAVKVATNMMMYYCQYKLHPDA